MSDAHPGGRRRAVEPEEIRRVMEEHPAPFLASSEIAEAADVSKPTVLNRLETLEERGEITSRRVGNVPVYYFPELDTDGEGDAADVEPEEPADPVTDGGVTAGARWLHDHGLVEPSSAREWEVVEKVAQNLLSAAALALVGILGVFAVVGVNNLLDVPAWVPVPSGAVTVVVGLIVWSVLITFVGAVGYWVLLFINYYE